MNTIYSIVPKAEYKSILKTFLDDDRPPIVEAMDANALVRMSDVLEPLTTGETLAMLKPLVYVFAKWPTGEIDHDDRAVYEYGVVKLPLWATAVNGEFLQVNVKPITHSVFVAMTSHGCTPVEIKIVQE